MDDQIILTGEIIDIHTAINTMDLIVIPSNRPESFGNVISESMANSKPVIISNIGGALEQVIDNKTGFIFKNGDYVDLSKKIDILLRDKNLRNDFGETGKIEYDKRFNPFIFKKKITTIYSKVL